MLDFLSVPLSQSLLIPLGLTAVASRADTGNYKMILGSGNSDSGTTTLMMSNEEIEHIIKIVKSLCDSSLLKKGAAETTENETKKIGRFFGVLLGTLGACLFENILAGKDVDAIRADHAAVWAGNRIIRAAESF